MSNVFLIGNAHIDPVWLWRWQEGFSEVLATFRSALDRMNDFPDFKFTSACAAYYMWVEQVDPEMFSEIKRRVSEGRWCITGGWLIQPDCNIPCGESYARHALISQRYFEEKFATHATCGYNVDSFGHNANLPQILSLSGMNNYCFMRPMPEEGIHKEYLFNWQSKDGSSVCTHRIPWYYAIDLTVMDTFGRIKDMAEHDGRDYMAFFGVGNHGGGPTIKLIHEINKLGIEGMVYSTPDEFFKTTDRESLPTVRDELQHHARGCYSLGSFVKSNNRRCEAALIAAESLALMAERLCGAEYPAAQLKAAWEGLLFNQFHDIMAGCTIKSAYTDAGYIYGETMAAAERIANLAMQKIAWNIDTLQGEKLPSYRERPVWTVWQHEVLGTPVVVFNPNAHAVRAPIAVYAEGKKVTDHLGNDIPFQLIRGEQTNGADKFNTAFIAQVEPFGYAVYRLFTEQESALQHENTLQVREGYMENEKIRITFDPDTGDISDFYDKTLGEHIISAPCRAVLLDETGCDSWAHDRFDLGEPAGEFGGASFSVLENGPVRAVLRSVVRFGESEIRRDFTLLRGDDRVSVRTKIFFREKHRTLKFSFTIEADSVTAKIPYGSIERRVGTGEEPCGEWVAAGNLCIANDSKHGYDTHDGALRMSILRSAIYADHFAGEHRDEFCEYMEQGEHEFTYSIFAYRSPAQADRYAQDLNSPLRAVVGCFHDGKLPESISCIGCENPNIVVTAIKRAEDADEALVRFYEANGADTHVTLKLFDSVINVQVGHDKIKTCTESGRELDLVEWEVFED